MNENVDEEQLLYHIMIGIGKKKDEECNYSTQYDIPHKILVRFEQSNQISQPKMYGIGVQIYVTAMFGTCVLTGG